MSKKKVFWISLVGTIAAYILVNPLRFGFCRDTYTFGESVGCLDKLAPILGLVIGLFAIVLLAFSLITYFLREEVFRAWVRFAYWWIPVSIVLIYLAKDSSGGGFGIPNVLDQESVSFILAALFAFISLLIIVWKYVASLPKY
ncbi:MAG: hypothetical protein Q8P17_03110 [bacterium]|nr:hypothetical protein [bacterium]